MRRADRPLPGTRLPRPSGWVMTRILRPSRTPTSFKIARQKVERSSAFHFAIEGLRSRASCCSQPLVVEQDLHERTEREPVFGVLPPAEPGPDLGPVLQVEDRGDHPPPCRLVDRPCRGAQVGRDAVLEMYGEPWCARRFAYQLRGTGVPVRYQRPSTRCNHTSTRRAAPLRAPKVVIPIVRSAGEESGRTSRARATPSKS
jgi:hypothetical protein